MSVQIAVRASLGNYAYGTDQHGNAAATFTRRDGVSACASCGRDFESGWVVSAGRYPLEFCSGCVQAVETAE